MYPVHLAPQAANSKISMKTKQTSGAVHSRPRPMPHCMVGCCLQLPVNYENLTAMSVPDADKQMWFPNITTDTGNHNSTT